MKPPLTLPTLGLFMLCGWAAAADPRPAVELACVAHGMGPLLECTVRVAREGQPLPGLQVSLGATMPSMPMAHSVKPVAAAPTGRPGEYRGTLALEMNGAWAVQVDLAGPADQTGQTGQPGRPLRDRVVRTLAVDECPGDRRCPVAVARPGAAGTGHGAHKH